MATPIAEPIEPAAGRNQRVSRNQLALRRVARVLIDFAVLALALWGGFSLRFDGSIPADWTQRMIDVMPWVLISQYLALHAFDVPRCSWRYLGLPEVQRTAAAVASASAVLLGLRLSAPTLASSIPAFAQTLVPIGAIAADAMLAFLGLCGVRGVARIAGERANLAAVKAQRDPVRMLLIGAGEAGVAVARELARRPSHAPVGFLDDDPAKHGVQIHGLRVLGPIDRLAEVCERERVDEILISVARASGALVRRVSEIGEALSLPVKIIPGIAELIDGKVSLERVRQVAIEDLLRRDPVSLDELAIAQTVRAKVVLVSGAGGSIGSELCRQICRYAPSRLLLVERAENALFEIHRELGRSFPAVELVPLLVDITERERLRNVFARHRPDLVVHAAAHKHVPLVEANALEGIRNNVIGAKVLVDAAVAAGVQRFVLISSDKAVRPTNVMGATKRWAELIVRHYGKGRGMRYCSVRFGNVLGSNGSVVPLFREQIASGGPVTLTDARMTRYFMSIHEAAELIVQAGAMAEGGDIFLLEMGEPVAIRDLAENMVRLAGLSVKGPANPTGDIAIVETGARPGEKLFEELFYDPANAVRTSQPKILRKPAARGTDGLDEALAALCAALAADNEVEARRVLFELVEAPARLEVSSQEP
ncbi:MAG TPA: nucleoside-diphosphate sugar epimerase/dehydratase [Enhygromyxa sp.]|nr:nucleoside-diphosphate sugar epimerase/dehydratase [Enhygromyxa sp.]